MEKNLNTKEIIYRIIAHPKTEVKTKGSKSTYNLKNMKFIVPAKLSLKIASLKRKNRIKLIREVIVIYEDRFVTNF